MFGKLNKRTREALELIETGGVGWSNGMGLSSVNLRFFHEVGISDSGFRIQESVDLGFLSERFYDRDGWRDGTTGRVSLTSLGREELAILRGQVS